jgi:hypothetical protein
MEPSEYYCNMGVFESHLHSLPLKGSLESCIGDKEEAELELLEC